MKNVLAPVVAALLLMGSLLLGNSCNSGEAETRAKQSARRAQVEQVARSFFAAYAERKDWEAFLSFYRYDMQFEDVVLQVKIFNKEDFQAFHNWPGSDYRPVAPGEPQFMLQQLIVNDSVAVGRGYFLPFYLDGQLYEWRWGSEFTIWLLFDEQLKIKRQIDFVEYPDWVLDEVVKGYREQR